MRSLPSDLGRNGKTLSRAEVDAERLDDAAQPSVDPRTLRVGFIIDSLRRHGTQRALLYLVCGLQERVYEQRVFCLNDAVDLDVQTRLASCGACVRVIGKKQLMAAHGVIALYQELRRWQPHIVQTFLPFGDVIGRTVAHVAGVPVIVSSIRARNIDKRRWQFLLDRITLRWVDRVVFNSQRVIPYSVEHEGVRADQVVCIPNCVRIVRQARPSPRAEARSRLDIPVDAFVIGTVGRLYPQKGHHYLLLAFRDVLSVMPCALLLVIGDGPLRSQLESEMLQLGISEHTRFLGERADVPDLLDILDLYVQPSIFEGMPNAVMEAMAVGKPVLATNVDGTQELITHGETGWLVESCNPEALAEQIIYALQNRDECARVGAAGARRMDCDFSVQSMVTAYDGLYRGLLASAGY
jgi:glycosyltransferase involved in cell wall biosynthesis